MQKQIEIFTQIDMNALNRSTHAVILIDRTTNLHISLLVGWPLQSPPKQCQLAPLTCLYLPPSFVKPSTMQPLAPLLLYYFQFGSIPTQSTFQVLTSLLLQWLNVLFLQRHAQEQGFEYTQNLFPNLKSFQSKVLKAGQVRPKLALRLSLLTQLLNWSMARQAHRLSVRQ